MGIRVGVGVGSGATVASGTGVGVGVGVAVGAAGTVAVGETTTAVGVGAGGAGGGGEPRIGEGLTFGGGAVRDVPEVNRMVAAATAIGPMNSIVTPLPRSIRSIPR